MPDITAEIDSGFKIAIGCAFGIIVGASIISIAISLSIEKAQKSLKDFLNTKIDDFQDSLKNDAEEYLKSAEEIVKEYLKTLNQIPKRGEQDIKKFNQNLERLEKTIAPGAYLFRILLGLKLR